jgi:glycosyltransferase involved in cell wall biosynthesis
MNVLINCSYTESFNMVTADGIAEGIPSVVSDAICWAPAYWRAGGGICSVTRSLRAMATAHC